MNPGTPARMGTDASVVNSVVNPAFWRHRSVLITGHTGFKGAWLSLWLQSLGAHVTGLSLGEPPSEPSLYALARVGEGMAHSFNCDIRDPPALTNAMVAARPEIVIHMAAQPLVRRSFASPRETYETNVMGTVNVLEAVRTCEGVRAVVIVTSDKCYENREWVRPYRESDPLGGHDPYSSSKAAAELVTSAYQRSFFSDLDGPHVATARAGNVVGGGDWGEDRLIPDIIRAVVGGEELRLRHPSAVRPWQHVLSPLSGYLVLAQALHQSPEYACAWNFGPEQHDERTVEWIVGRVSELLPGGVRWVCEEGPHPHEAQRLQLDSSQAHERLGWTPLLDLNSGIEATVDWYRRWREQEDPQAVTLAQLSALGG